MKMSVYLTFFLISFYLFLHSSSALVYCGCGYDYDLESCGCGTSSCQYPSTTLDLRACDIINASVSITSEENIVFNAQYITGNLRINVNSDNPISVSFPRLQTIGGGFYPYKSLSEGSVDIPILTCIGGNLYDHAVQLPSLNLGMSAEGIHIGGDVHYDASHTNFTNANIVAINGSIYYGQCTAMYDWPYLKTLVGTVNIHQTTPYSSSTTLNFQSLETLGAIYLDMARISTIDLRSLENFYDITYDAISCYNAVVEVLLPYNRTVVCSRDQEMTCDVVPCNNGTVPIITEECVFTTSDGTISGGSEGSKSVFALVAGCAAGGAVFLLAAGLACYWKAKGNKNYSVDSTIEKLLP